MKLHPAEVERLVSEHYANLYRFALSLARNEAEAADLTQQTYFQLASKGGQLRDISKAKSWLFTTLYREFLSLRRHSDRFTSIDSEEATAEQAGTVEADAVRRADASVVMDALRKMREIYRVPLAFFYIDDLSYRDIARILDVPIGTVMSRLSRGKAELRSRLADAITCRKPADANNVIPMRRSAND